MAFRHFRAPGPFRGNEGLPYGPFPGSTEDLRVRLSWAHGEQRASAIMGGEDQDTLEDLASWQRLLWRARHLDSMFE